MQHVYRQLSKPIGFIVVLSLLLTLPALVAAADNYPNKPVRMVIAYPPGGGNELTGRLMSTKLTERLGKPVIIDNRGGAGGVIGTEFVARAEPDGYTLLFIAPSHVTNPALQKLPYDAVKDFAPIAKLGSGPYVLAVHPSVPVNTLKEFVARAKQKAGEMVIISTGSGGTNHMGTELFADMAGVQFKIVQYKGGGPALIALLGGHGEAEFINLATAIPHIKSGKLKVIATCGAKRSVLLPEYPTIAELGYPGYELSGFWGILAPAGTPAPIVERLTKEIKEILATNEAKKVIEDQGSQVDYLGPAEFTKFLENEIANWTRIAKKANIKMEQ